MALSGDTASFLAGGEYPDPGARRARHRSPIEYKRYGVGLAFTPTVLGDGLINLKIEPEVSQLDPTTTVTIGTASSIPPLIVRRASTTVELRDGQSFVIGGLLQSDGQSRSSSSCPGSATCRCSARCSPARSYQKNETDLAIIVTPRLVRPARPGDVIRTPLDNTLPANDVDFFLMGKTEIARADGARCIKARRRADSPATCSICRREAPMLSRSAN